ncbi:hypothetical protein B0O99DRAFT_600064 [Bisporella sp. PMI_857]|nr:hypothetical protein B0O99DRAFT_600064 [Bisporella sp. PMI_857]
MLHASVLLALLAATSVNSIPIPLNINLGAFSPALVVGDGEISFGGEADVTSLMTALSGASQEASENSAATIQRAGAEVPNGASIVTPATTETSSALASATAEVAAAAILPQGLNGIGRKEKTNDIEPRIADTDSVEKRDVTTVETRDTEEEKRDLAGFNAALAFATEALKTSPGVQLGTGEGGSGIGIKVEPGTQSGAAAAAPAAGEKRDVSKRAPLPTVTMLKVRTIGDSSSVPAKKTRRDSVSKPVKARQVQTRRVQARQEQVDIDSINLNIGGDGQEYELTIAEIKP